MAGFHLLCFQAHADSSQGHAPGAVQAAENLRTAMNIGP